MRLGSNERLAGNHNDFFIWTTACAGWQLADGFRSDVLSDNSKVARFKFEKPIGSR